MGYRGKLEEQQRARELRAQAWTLQEIADELDVSKSSVSVWVRDVEFERKPRKRSVGRRRYGARKRGPNKLRRRKLRQIERLDREGRRRIGQLGEGAFLSAGAALYWGEGFKTDGAVGMANTDPEALAFFCAWLRHFFDIDETRLRGRLYLHEGLDLRAATEFWSAITQIPTSQFTKPYRAKPDGGIRNSKHVYGCMTVTYSCSRTHRTIMGMVRGLSAQVPVSVDQPLPFMEVHDD